MSDDTPGSLKVKALASNKAPRVWRGEGKINLFGRAANIL